MNSAARPLFVATILVGSFLLFLVQPMVARLALPQLGGAPNVWNSAMLVYQALLLAGYAYAHVLQRLPVARQAMVHIGLFVLAATTLPIGLANLAPPQPGLETLWVPMLFLASIGPVFFLVSAQAPLMQRWFAANPNAGEPYALYAASNLGSFAGLLAYPLVVEPNFSLAAQGWIWTAGYGVLVVLISFAAWQRRTSPLAMPQRSEEPDETAEPVGWRRIALWTALAAVPSGLMLSTTTHLTTDMFAMPLLWVIPLGIYLLSFVFSFSDNRLVANFAERIAPFALLLVGGMAATVQTNATLNAVFAELVMLFIVATALHSRLYRHRPPASQLTLFYLVMSAGGVLGGLFTALIAPLMFDWVWEHPLLVLAAAALVPQRPWIDWIKRFNLPEQTVRLAYVLIIAVAILLTIHLDQQVEFGTENLLPVLGLTCLIALCGIMALGRRAAFLIIMVALMIGRGGWSNVKDSEGEMRERSYFGIYSIRDFADGTRQLAHGSTLHGMQLRTPGRELTPTTYYGPNSGAGLAIRNAPTLFGPGASVGVVGLGTGTLSCYRKPDQHWTFFEIDPTVLSYSQNHAFTFLANCAPKMPVVIGDARLELAKGPAARFDVLAIDAFSSDAIPLHLLTTQAMDVYERALKPDGILLIHISNRFMDLRPVVSALADARGWQARARFDDDPGDPVVISSDWIALSRDPASLDRLVAVSGDARWTDLPPPDTRVWTDQFASVLPFIRWDEVLGR